MDFCSHLVNATIGSTNITWGQATSNLLSADFKRDSYLRPDTAGALLPWIYTIVLTIVHIPVVLIRVVRWQAVQYWCLVFTFFTIVIYIQAYISTAFDASKVLVWTPLILVIDAGSMLQVFFLIVEAKKESVEDQIEDVEKNLSPLSPSPQPRSIELQDRNSQPPENANTVPNTEQSEGSSNLLAPESSNEGNTAAPAIPPPAAIEPDPVRRRAVIPDGFFSSGAVANAKGQRRWYRDPTNYAMISAAVLFIIVLVLQILGLVKAAQATSRSPEPPSTSWCSPLFQPFGLAAVDGNCNVYPIDQSAHRGIGCIHIPGQWQQHWLKGSVAGISIELVTELIDLLILSLVNGRRKIFQAVKLKRPWTTMFSGLVVLIVTLIYGFNYSQYLPPGLTEKVMVFMDVQGPAAYAGTLTGGGLRGTIIGWNDGLFESWKATYFGNWSP
ncbi:hypothetical protein ACLMJK_005630 [Lecanora helva]